MKKYFLLVISSLIFSGLSLFAELYMKEATVSFYADDFHGKKTSSGEIFNMNELTCANKSLPFNTQLKVTNLANGKAVVVRVNDRGPFVLDRELDLSKAAAEKIGMINSGTAKVSIEILKRGENTDISKITAEKAMKIASQKSGKTYTQTVATSAKSVGPSSYPAGTNWDLQVGAFSTRENANELAQRLLSSGFKEVVFQQTSTVYRVVIRNVPADKVEKTKKKLIEKGFSEPLVRQRKI
jgi:rare lipoprotein A